MKKIDQAPTIRLQLPSIRTVSVNLLIGLSVGYLGPFGSFGLPLASRLLYWVILIAAGHLLYHTAGKVFTHFLREKNWHDWLVFLVPTIVASVLLTFVVVFVSNWFFSSGMTLWQHLLFSFPKVLVLGLVLNAFGSLLKHYHTSKEVKTKGAEAQKGALFLNRLPKKLGQQLICFSMDDHYLHVHTEQGSDMMLLRMKDALAELADYPGFQVHRSWWVATDAITDIKKEPRKATLTMSNDMEVPVSQKYLPQLKSLDWI